MPASARRAGPDRRPPSCLGAASTPGQVLCREVMLPLAAARDLQAVLGFEMDRLTPFAADEVFWGVSGKTPDRARDKLRLRLAIVPRAQVAALLRPAGAPDLVPSFIERRNGRIPLKERAASAPPAALAGLRLAWRWPASPRPLSASKSPWTQAAAIVAERPRPRTRAEPAPAARHRRRGACGHRPGAAPAMRCRCSPPSPAPAGRHLARRPHPQIRRSDLRWPIRQCRQADRPALRRAGAAQPEFHRPRHPHGGRQRGFVLLARHGGAMMRPGR